MYLKFLQKLKKLNKTQPTYETIKFFRSGSASTWIWVVILENFYTKKFQNIEYIIRDIPTEYASRPTLFKIINYAVKKKYLLKQPDVKDRRKNNIFPSNLTIKEFESWSKEFF